MSSSLRHWQDSLGSRSRPRRIRISSRNTPSWRAAPPIRTSSDSIPIDLTGSPMTPPRRHRWIRTQRRSTSHGRSRRRYRSLSTTSSLQRRIRTPTSTSTTISSTSTATGMSSPTRADARFTSSTSTKGSRASASPSCCTPAIATGLGASTTSSSAAKNRSCTRSGLPMRSTSPASR